MVYVVDGLTILYAYPGLETFFSLCKLNHAGTIAAWDVVIDGVATRVATLGKQYAIPLCGVVVYVVVTHEYSHHITTLQHSSSKTCVDGR